MVKAPNYLYPLATDKVLQWTKQAVKGENRASKAVRPKSFNAPKKEVMRVLVQKSKLPSFGKPQRTRKTVHPSVDSTMPTDPMKAPDPRPGNAMHITNTPAMYNGHQN